MQLEALFTDLFELGGCPSLVEAGRLMEKYPEELFYLAGIPVALQRAVGSLARTLAR